MRKIFKKIFCRTFLVIFILTLEIVAIIGGIIWCISTPSWGIAEQIISLILLILLIIQIVAIFKVIYKQTDAEFKIPWLIILLLFPFVGGLFYLLFKPRGLRTKQREIMAAQSKIGLDHFLNRKIDDDKLGFGARTINYVQETTHLIATPNNRVKYYKSGEVFFPAFLEALKQAEKFIYLEFFIIKNDSWWKKIYEVLKQKAADGVDVRILYDDMGCLGTLPSYYDVSLQKEGINCRIFNRLNPIISGFFNNRDHRKIAIIDHKCAFTGGINIGDEYANINSPFGYWKDTMIRIEGEAINNLIKIFYFNWCLTIKKSDPKMAEDLDYKYPKFDDPGYVYPFGHGPGPFYKERCGEHTLINIIESAKRELWISSPYFIPSEALFYSIRRAALAGVDVKLFLPGIPDKRLVYWIAQTYFNSLMASGVKIYLYVPGFNHEKCIVADGRLAFIGTINMDFRSLVHHFECGAILYDVPCIKDMCKDFQEMKTVSNLVPGTYKIGFFKAFICSILKVFGPLL